MPIKSAHRHSNTIKRGQMLFAETNRIEHKKYKIANWIASKQYKEPPSELEHNVRSNFAIELSPFQPITTQYCI